MKHVMLILCCAMSILSAQNDRMIQIKVDRAETIEKLIAQNHIIPDIKSFTNKQGRLEVEWLNENGYVTVIGSPSLVKQLKYHGYTVLSNKPYIKKTPAYSANSNYPLQFGWPRIMSGWPAVYGQATTVADFNGNGDLELFLSNIEGFMYMWRNNGTFVLGYPLSPLNNGWSTASREGAAAGDINGDGILEAVLGQAVGLLRANQYTSLPLNGFPHQLGTWIWTNEPALYDFDDDGRDEIVLVTYEYPSAVPEGPAEIHVLNEDLTELPGWPQQMLQHSESSPAIGDIDGDGLMEIVVGSGQSTANDIAGELLAFNHDGSVCSGFPILVGPDVNASPALYDIDMNGTLDILIRIKPDTGANGIYAFDGTGQSLPGFPAVLTRGGSKNGVPAIADVNGDGLPEIAYGTVEAVDSARVWLFSNSGQIIPGFPKPVFATWVEESVVLEDVSGDGLADIICGTNGVGSDYAQLWAFDYQGNVIPDFPIQINETFSTLETTPTVIDFDNDGDTEIITASHDGTVYVFDTPGIPAASSWPMFKFNHQRQSSNTTSITGISSVFSPTPQRAELLPTYPNPFNPSTTIRYRLATAKTVHISIYNVLGKKLVTLLNGEQQAGEHELLFDASNYPSGIYLISLYADGQSFIQKALLSR
ncbi:MAG: T9SS type A sorting domain-containing protein [Calditrichia bacterium]